MTSLFQYWENYEREDDQLRREAETTRRLRYAGGREIEAERLEPDAADRGPVEGAIRDVGEKDVST